jgi:hypothetical protein
MKRVSQTGNRTYGGRAPNGGRRIESANAAGILEDHTRTEEPNTGHDVRYDLRLAP